MKEIKTLEYVDYSYKLNEMLEDMKKAYSNNNVAIKKQEDVLNDLLTIEGAKEKHKEFIETYNEMLKQAYSKNKILEERINKLEDILLILNNDTSGLCSCIISLLFEVFGVTNQEQKSVKERKENKEEVKTYIA